MRKIISISILTAILSGCVYNPKQGNEGSSSPVVSPTKIHQVEAEHGVPQLPEYTPWWARPEYNEGIRQ